MIRNLLAIRLSAMGDVAMTVPVIDSLARRYPDLCVTVLTVNRLVPFSVGCLRMLRSKA